MTALLKTETKLLLREPILLFWGVAFPLVLLTVMGLAGDKPDPDLGGLSLVQSYVPILVAFTFTILGVSALPTAVATYRERGVLRRLATTPLRPSRVLAAQLATSGAMAAVTAVLILALARTAFGVGLPGAPLAFLLALILAAAALLGIGLVIAALAPRARIAGAMGTMLFFPLMFFAGLWAPRATMGATLRDIGDYTPLGAAVQALQDASAGAWPDAKQLLVMLAYAVVSAVAATRLFRWQ
ncbi:ABC transporter permease [Candidatus Solirubrobacter pratensis]|uniref:ABC transporter permease n=1 Tax=Candidatus Solirubrobacter pratensis TaxID=1298857 RepID=UPI000415E2E4|nr:ABC transporter permease [Candidatus Solirubrobacter pratensis]